MDTLLKSHFLSLYCMVLADGIVEAKELETLYRIGVEQYGITPEQITECVKSAGTSFVFPTTFSERLKFLYNMAEIAVADGVVDDSEKELLRKYVIKLDFEEENAVAISEFVIKAVEDRVSFDELLECITKGK